MLSKTKMINCFKYPQREKLLSVWLVTQCVSFTHKKKTDYRYPGIKDTLLPQDTLLLVLTLVNITFTCTTYVAASVLICVSCQRTACLVKSGNQNINGVGVRVEVAEPAVQRGTGNN